ncbi:MAG: lipoate--protein ligase family protein [Gammaproteobacteria bacterium]|nr:lipoate--protein ligase family protein [Gammaproteobacteria bacterium]MBU6509925.1 lipoate--protein ligase family protein [Gammaproteobacteria bacterium]MDE1984162.1 lipoate--protein ligase family protein [Gammaproteobacteria bacterium]MDE2108531.1 lipoate--protein ligase family protein [Gammaproteobacteria bacterium]
MSRSRWSDYRWRLVHAPAQLPSLHMALDEVLTASVGAGRRAPTLRIWEWAAPAVIIGRYQSLRNEVDARAAQQHGIKVMRRISGGGAMFVEPGNTITYSLYAPAALVEGMSFQEAYAFLDAWVIEALRSMGIEASYQPLNDISSPLGKIAGAAQARRHGAVLHHVTMAYDIDAAKMLQVLRIGREKISDKGIASAAKRVDPLRSQTGLARAAVIERMIDTFRGLHGLADEPLKDRELDEAQTLAKSKFETPEWTGIVP